MMMRDSGGEVHGLLRQRWNQLLDAGETNPDELLSDLAEEPHSFIFGHVALACLDLRRYDKEIQDIACTDVEGRVRAMAVRLQGVSDRLGQLSRLSQFYLWPLQLLLDSEGLDPAAVKNSAENSARSAAEYAAWLCIKCVQSPVWIKGGGDAGSWGFNVKNTQAIVTSLVEFWRYALASEEREARFEEVFSRLETPPSLRP
ncbi:MAG TPA: hypothetical protein VEL74_22530 [Thermoanaerobaculia bacterium]|nr:hypothetical protein [Thermoanaerobaculia bacterium]